MGRGLWCAWGLLLAQNAWASDELGVVGTWNMVVSIETSTCRDQGGMELAQQWSISLQANGTYEVKATGAQLPTDQTVYRPPMAGKNQRGILRVAGVVGAEIYATHIMTTTSAWDLRVQDGQMSGTFLASLPGPSTKVKKGTSHIVCTVAGTVRGNRP